MHQNNDDIVGMMGGEHKGAISWVQSVLGKHKLQGKSVHTN